MTGSLLDILPPEAQTILGIAALLLIALGLVVWSAGIKVARGVVAALLGLVVAALAAWALPIILGIATATAGIVGFAIGALAGALGFRLLQGLTLAVCLGLAVAATYYHLHVETHSLPPTAAAAVEQDTVKASDLLIQGPIAGHAPAPAKTAATTRIAAEARADAQVFAAKLLDRWNAISSTDQRRLLAASIGTAAVALLLAFGFPRHTTWVISALLGTLMLLAGAQAAFHLYLPKLESFLPQPPSARYALVAILTLIGLLIQYHFFWPRKKAAKPAEQPAPAPAAMGAA